VVGVKEDTMTLRSMNELRGYAIHAIDSEIGAVDQFLFDDEQWTIRYLVVTTGGWLTGRLVLISPIALGTVDWKARTLDIALTSEQIEHSPDITTDQPVSRQKEEEYFRYYGYPPYWVGPGLWGPGLYPGQLASVTAGGPTVNELATERQFERDAAEPGDPHLRSTQEVTGYAIQARDGAIGHVEDFLLDDDTWAIRYMVVDTRNWWPGKQVLVAPQWITEVSWTQSAVTVDLSRDSIKRSPEYDPATMINRDYETRLYRHYSRPGYWEER
jgi:hypothetical protein